jgi:Fe2+ transport system protein FeoA
MSSLDTLPLHELRTGQTAVVEELCGCAEDCALLAEMGFRAGEFVKVIASGRPCAVQVGQCRVMLRGRHTSIVRVSLLA